MSGNMRLLYVTPEKLAHSPAFFGMLQSLYAKVTPPFPPPVIFFTNKHAQ